MPYKLIFIFSFLLCACGVSTGNFYSRKYTNFKGYQSEEIVKNNSIVKSQYEMYAIENNHIDSLLSTASLQLKPLVFHRTKLRKELKKGIGKTPKIERSGNELPELKSMQNASEDDAPKRRGGFENTRSWIKGVTVMGIGLLMVVLSNIAAFGVLFAIFGYTLIFFGLIMVIIDFI